MRQRATVQNIIFAIAAAFLLSSCAESGFAVRATGGAEDPATQETENPFGETSPNFETLPNEPDEMKDDSSLSNPAQTDETGSESSTKQSGDGASSEDHGQQIKTAPREDKQAVGNSTTRPETTKPDKKSDEAPESANSSQSDKAVTTQGSGEPAKPESSQPKAPSPRFAEWASVKAPSQGPVEIIGGYAGGCIAGASQLTENSNDYVVMKPSRLRNHGHPALVQYLEQLARKIRDDKLPPMLIEDMSGPRGGPVLKGHASHQTGLDVDISLEFFERPLSLEERETHTSPSYVIDRKVLKPEWSKNQEQLIVRAAEPGEVARIFVAPGIKKHFCEKYPDAPWLYKLRAWWGHDDHIHVRLNCPAGQKSCKPQPALNPKETQCGKDLQEWFSKSADRQWANIQAHWAKNIPKPFPWLPAQCEKVRVAQ